MGQIRLVRVYEAAEGHPAHDEVASAASGEDRPSVFLVDRLWPRGIAKKSLPYDLWTKQVGPSDGLRKWFGHDPEKFDEFARRYGRELDDGPEGLSQVLEAAEERDIVLLYSAKDEQHNQAVVLRRWINAKR